MVRNHKIDHYEKGEIHINSKSSLVSLLALSAMTAGIYKNIDIPTPKPIRNVPEYARKKDQGRNEKCSCGSGKKYKKCCGR